MAIDFLNTYQLLQAVKEQPPMSTFLRDRYFPTNDATDIFATTKVLVEYKDGNRKVATFVSPRRGGITILRDGSKMREYEPPLLAPRRMLTIDDLKRRGFGEALMSDLTPEDREAAMTLNDIQELGDMITRREEVMAAETLINNKCTIKEYADDLTTVVREDEIKFYDEATNPASYTPTTKWGTTGCDILGDIYAMIQMLAKRGLPANELLVAPDVAQLIIGDETIKKLFDINNYKLGTLEPIQEETGVSRLGIINVYGPEVTIYTVAGTYQDGDGTEKAFFPAGNVVLTSPAAGRTVYGAVTQLEQMDGNFHTYAERRVPKYIADAVGNTRSATLSSAPLLIPNHMNPWISSKVTA